MNDLDKIREGLVLLIDKPLEWTSFDVVNKIRGNIRRAFDIKKIKVGHAGTLDPLATGLLIVCTGKFTKRIDEIQGLPKTYTGTLKLGATTPSYDAEAEEDQIFPTAHITEEMIYNAVSGFLGEIDQYPPMHSAVKVGGRKLYELARKGLEVELKPRKVEITRFEITAVNMPYVDFIVDCSKGTYIRSLAHDFGKALDSGAYLTALRRTHIGEYSVDDADNSPLEQSYFTEP